MQNILYAREYIINLIKAKHYNSDLQFLKPCKNGLLWKFSIVYKSRENSITPFTSSFSNYHDFSNLISSTSPFIFGFGCGILIQNLDISFNPETLQYVLLTYFSKKTINTTIYNSQKVEKAQMPINE